MVEVVFDASEGKLFSFLSQHGRIAIQYEEILIDNQVNFIPKVKAIGDLSSYYGHREINANKQQLVIPNGTALDLENSIDCVTINGVEYSINLAPHSRLKQEVMGNPNCDEEFWGTHYARKQQIIITEKITRP